MHASVMQELVRVAAESRIEVPNFNDFVEVRVCASEYVMFMRLVVTLCVPGVEPAELYPEKGRSAVSAADICVSNSSDSALMVES